MIWWAANSARKGEGEGIAFLLALTALLLGAAGDLAGLSNLTLAATGHPIMDVAITCALVLLSIMALIAHRNMSRRLAHAQATILTAHEAERSRLSRDVHDGVGQWLTTIKLGLEMKQADGAGDLSDVVGQVEGAGVAGVARHLRICVSLSSLVLSNLSVQLFPPSL